MRFPSQLRYKPAGKAMDAGASSEDAASMRKPIGISFERARSRGSGQNNKYCFSRFCCPGAQKENKNAFISERPEPHRADQSDAPITVIAETVVH